MSDDERARNIVDLLRSVMYSADDGNHNLFAEIKDLAEQLNEYDQITIPISPNQNRLIVLARNVKKNQPELWDFIEHLND